jgi:hypothetical protein
MKTITEEYIEQSIPHEAGHIVVGRILGIPVFRLEHEVLSGPNGELLAGNFITKGLAPTDPLAVIHTPPDAIEAYVAYVGGGLAGNYVSGTTATEHGLEKDREQLKLVSARTLEDVATKDSKPIIEANRDVWERLQAALKDSYQKLLKDNIMLGRHTLLDGQQLEAICPQNKIRFPAFWNVGPVR